MRALQALHHANKAHGRRTDKNGFLYLLHPVAVAFAVSHLGEDFVVCALLHDVDEDEDYTAHREALSPRQRNALALLTHDPEETYREYVELGLLDEVFCAVKLADMGHNTHPKRRTDSTQRLADERYYPYASLVWSALEWLHHYTTDEVERIFYAHPYPYDEEEA